MRIAIGQIARSPASPASRATPGKGRARVSRCRSRSVSGQRTTTGTGAQEAQEKMNRSTPRHLLHYVTRRLRLRQYLKDPGDGRQQPQIPAQALLWALLIGQILRQSSFHAVEALVRSSARRTLSIATPFCDDTLGYFTERLDPGPTRQALLSLIRGAKRNKAFDDCRWIGLAIDGTGAGWRTHVGCKLCRPKQSAVKQILGYQHAFVMVSVVGTGLSLPFDGEPYGPGDSEYAAGQRLLRRVLQGVGKRFAQYVVVDGEFATAPFLHTAGELGLHVVARLKDNLPDLFAAARHRFPSGPPTTVFQHGPDRVEVWDAEDFDPWKTLEWETVRVFFYRQHKADGTVVEAYWLTNFLPGALLLPCLENILYFRSGIGSHHRVGASPLFCCRRRY